MNFNVRESRSDVAAGQAVAAANRSLFPAGFESGDCFWLVGECLGTI